MPHFRKRPVVVEAEQFRVVDCIVQLPLPFAGRCNAVQYDEAADAWYVVTAHGQRAYLTDGDWVIAESDDRGYYPCKPDILAATYDLVPAEPGSATYAAGPGSAVYSPEAAEDLRTENSECGIASSKLVAALPQSTWAAYVAEKTTLPTHVITVGASTPPSLFGVDPAAPALPLTSAAPALPLTPVAADAPGTDPDVAIVAGYLSRYWSTGAAHAPSPAFIKAALSRIDARLSAGTRGAPGPAWRDVAASAYRAYAASIGDKTLGGDPMPAFGYLPQPNQTAWEAVARQVGDVLDSGPSDEARWARWTPPGTGTVAAPDPYARITLSEEGQRNFEAMVDPANPAGKRLPTRAGPGWGQ